MQSLLDSIVFIHPLPAIVAFLIALGLLNIGVFFASKYYSKAPSIVESTSGYVFAIILIGFISDLSLHGAINFYILNVFAIILGLLGVAQLRKIYLQKQEIIDFIIDFRGSYKFEVFIVVTILGALLLASLGPPTDADSLDYHLGVPATWLFNGHYVPLDSWYHARFTGLGERIIFFGLVNGTDVLSSLFQWSGLFVSIVALFSMSSKGEKKDLVLASLLTLSAPLIIFMVLNQKPYLFPVSVITLGVALLFDNQKHFDKKLYLATFLILSSLLFKYTFLLSMASISILMLFLAWKNDLLVKFIMVGIVLSIIILFPHYFRNYVNYSDPFSPLFSSFIASSESSLINFANYLKQGYQPTFENIIRVPITQGIFTSRLSLISTVVGLGGLGILAAYFSKKTTSKIIMLAFSLSFLVIVILGRPISRLMFDIYLLGGMALIASDLDKVKVYLIKILSLQSIVVLALSVYSAFLIFPGSFSDSNRDRVMLEMANGYSVAKLIGRILPEDAILLTDLRSKALIPRKVVLADNIDYAKDQNSIERIILAEDGKNNITHVVLKLPFSNKYKSLVQCAESDKKVIYDVEKMARNPLNKANYQILVFKINRSNLCFLD